MRLFRRRPTPEPELERYVEAKETAMPPGSWIAHLDGVAWWDRPAPARSHVCLPASRGFIAGAAVERCPCGAYRVDDQGPWQGRNLRDRNK